MRFFNSGNNKGGIQTLLMALLLACGLWYMIVGREQVETQMEISLGYRGLPSSLVVTGGLRNSVTVRLRGSAELLRVLQNRGASYTVDLSGIVRGDNSVRINIDRAAEYNAFDIVSISPNRLRIRADELFTKEVGLLPRMAELNAASKARDLEVTDVRVEPEKIRLTGPQGFVDRVREMPVDYDPNRNPEVGDYRVPIQLPIPEQVTADVQSAELIYSVRQASGTVMVTREVSILRKDEAGGLPVLDEGRRPSFEYEPKTVIVVLNIPRSRMISQSQGDPDYMAQVMVTASEPGYNLDVINIPVDVVLPEGASVVWKSTDFITARRVQRQKVPEALSGLTGAEQGGGDAEAAMQADPGEDRGAVSAGGEELRDDLLSGSAGAESGGSEAESHARPAGTAQAEGVPSDRETPDDGNAVSRDTADGNGSSPEGPGPGGSEAADALTAPTVPDGSGARQPGDNDAAEEKPDLRKDAAENAEPGREDVSGIHARPGAGTGMPGQIPADSFVFRTPESGLPPDGIAVPKGNGHPAGGM